MTHKCMTCMLHILQSMHSHNELMQAANAYLDQILSEAGTKVPADSAPDVSSDVRKGDSLPKLLHM